jgi:hypothetical protein
MQVPAGFGISQRVFSMLSLAAIYSRQEVGENTPWDTSKRKPGKAEAEQVEDKPVGA